MGVQMCQKHAGGRVGTYLSDNSIYVFPSLENVPMKKSWEQDHITFSQRRSRWLERSCFRHELRSASRRVESRGRGVWPIIIYKSSKYAHSISEKEWNQMLKMWKRGRAVQYGGLRLNSLWRFKLHGSQLDFSLYFLHIPSSYRIVYKPLC